MFCFVLFPHVDKFSCNTVSPHELCNKITSGEKKRNTVSVFFYSYYYSSLLTVLLLHFLTGFAALGLHCVKCVSVRSSLRRTSILIMQGPAPHFWVQRPKNVEKKKIWAWSRRVPGPVFSTSARKTMHQEYTIPSCSWLNTWCFFKAPMSCPLVHCSCKAYLQGCRLVMLILRCLCTIA